MSRDVLVNVLLKGDAAEAAGVAGHVCELQLVLLPFHQLRCAPGFDRLSDCVRARARACVCPSACQPVCLCLLVGPVCQSIRLSSSLPLRLTHSHPRVLP